MSGTIDIFARTTMTVEDYLKDGEFTPVDFNYIIDTLKTNKPYTYDIIFLIKNLSESNIPIEKLECLSAAIKCAKEIKENKDMDLKEIIDEIYVMSGGIISTEQKKEIDEQPKINSEQKKDKIIEDTLKKDKIIEEDAPEKIEEVKSESINSYVKAISLPKLDKQEEKPIEKPKTLNQMTEREKYDYIKEYDGDIKQLLAQFKFDINVMKTNYDRDGLNKFKSWRCDKLSNCKYNEKCLFEHFGFNDRRLNDLSKKVFGLQGHVINIHFEKIQEYLKTI